MKSLADHRLHEHERNAEVLSKAASEFSKAAKNSDMAYINAANRMKQIKIQTDEVHIFSAPLHFSCCYKVP